MKKKIKQKNNKININNNKQINKKNTPKKTPEQKKVIAPNNNILENKNYKLAMKLYKKKNYEETYEILLNLLIDYPKNKLIYKKIIECLTRDYTYKDNSKNFKNNLNDYVTTYKLLITKRELNFFETKMEEYKSIKTTKSKSKFLLIAILGFLGIHKFIEKKYLLGVVYLFTFGIFGIGIIIDLINDYAEYENDTELDILRYIISIIILIIGLFRINTSNFYYIVIASVLLTPIIYSKILRLFPNIIKIIAFVLLLYFGLKTFPIIYYVPNNIIGTWITENENTNYKEIIIAKDQTTIKFNDRKNQKGNNEYKENKKLLEVIVSEKVYYKFKIDLEKKTICTYNESNKCVVLFNKKTN